MDSQDEMATWKPGRERGSRRESSGQQTGGDILFEAVSMVCAKEGWPLSKVGRVGNLSCGGRDRARQLLEGVVGWCIGLLGLP